MLIPATEISDETIVPGWRNECGILDRLKKNAITNGDGVS